MQDGKHRLNNGSIYEVGGFDESGNIVLDNGWTVTKDFGHLDYGYTVTSFASQGKTVDRVFVGQGFESLPASSREQFYVSASRARQQVAFYTGSKQELLEAVSRSDERLTATELLHGGLPPAIRAPERSAEHVRTEERTREHRELVHER
ncbi:MAG: hypothetical protein KF708_08900 [Pirellulales bacterium]|nr:hypothetical protein [Pirellulales bacterium]